MSEEVTRSSEEQYLYDLEIMLDRMRQADPDLDFEKASAEIVERGTELIPKMSSDVLRGVTLTLHEIASFGKEIDAMIDSQSDKIFELMLTCLEQPCVVAFCGDLPPFDIDAIQGIAQQKLQEAQALIAAHADEFRLIVTRFGPEQVENWESVLRRYLEGNHVDFVGFLRLLEEEHILPSSYRKQYSADLKDSYREERRIESRNRRWKKQRRKEKGG